MRLSVRAAALAVILGVVLCIITACSAPASYAVRVAYLKQMAKEGVQTHDLIASQGCYEHQKLYERLYGFARFKPAL
jgi:hypothetical protein